MFHCAAQPSHDLAASRPFDDFEVNAIGTLNLLESARRHCPETPFVFMSTNKVYGDAPNELELSELETRYDYADPADRDGIDETMRIDSSMHSIFGASKAAADLLVQEYGRYFGMPTSASAPGASPGRATRRRAPRLSRLHRPLHPRRHSVSRLRLQGQAGPRQHPLVRRLHGDLAFAGDPRPAAVYNLGGGRSNSVSLLEAIAALEDVFGRRLDWSYVDEPRRGDHICYISDCSRFRTDYPSWEVTIGLDEIFAQLGELRAPRAIASDSMVIPS